MMIEVKTAEGKDVSSCYPDLETTIETYTGRKVDVAKVSAPDVDFRDVAHSLSLMCRFGGHCRRFYSVAAHSVFCHDEAARRGVGYKRLLLAVLIHDAGEAYWHDLGRPLKNAWGMTAYKRYLDEAQRATEIAAGLNVENDLTDQQRKFVKTIDDAVLKTEAERLMLSKGKEWGWLSKIEGAKIPWWRWQLYRFSWVAERGFLRRLRRCGVKA